MQDLLGHKFYTIVRSLDALRTMLGTDPHAAFSAPPGAKRVVSFVRVPITARLSLPLKSDGAQILGVLGRDIFTAYVPSE